MGGITKEYAKLCTVLLLLILNPCDGFMLPNVKNSAISIDKRCFTLHGMKRGSLRKNIGVGGSSDVVSNVEQKTKQVTKKKGSKKPTKNSSEEGGVSPLLAQWAQGTPPSDDDSSSTQTPVKQPTKSVKRSPEKTKTSERRTKQAERKVEEASQLNKETTLLKRLEFLLEQEKNRDIPEIISTVRELIRNGSSRSNMRLLSSSKQPKDFRMLWAGSDIALTHFGTGLHKVPLARLQEVFMTLSKSKIEVGEVIRILGPFPNVKNTLRGQCSCPNSETLKIVYDSMVDGTGKEILAGKDENEKRVSFKVLLATENVLVWEVPEDVVASGEENGENLLIFVREYDLDERLDILRVSGT